MKLQPYVDFVLYTARDAKTKKPAHPTTVQLVIATESRSPIGGHRHPDHVHLILDLDLARKVSRLLRRSATRAGQRAAKIAEQDLRAATAPKRRIRRSKAPAIEAARDDGTRRSRSPAPARKRPAGRYRGSK